MTLVAVVWTLSGCWPALPVGVVTGNEYVGSIQRDDDCWQDVEAYLTSGGYERAQLFSEMDDRCQRITMSACRGEKLVRSKAALSWE